MKKIIFLVLSVLIAFAGLSMGDSIDEAIIAKIPQTSVVHQTFSLVFGDRVTNRDIVIRTGSRVVEMQGFCTSSGLIYKFDYNLKQTNVTRSNLSGRPWVLPCRYGTAASQLNPYASYTNLIQVKAFTYPVVSSITNSGTTNGVFVIPSGTDQAMFPYKVKLGMNTTYLLKMINNYTTNQTAYFRLTFW